MLKFEEFLKIDAHFHAFPFDSIYLQIAKENNLHYVNINTDTSIFPPMQQQEAISLSCSIEHSKYVSYITSFAMKGWTEVGWLNKVIADIDTAIANGAVAVKVWKNIGMEVKKESGEYLMIDDPFFYPLFKHLSDKEIPVVAHLGEPKNCWLPLDEMTTKRNKAYFSAHPEYHAYLHPEIPAYEMQLEARDNVLLQHPNLIFVGAHMGSMEWSYREVAKRFERFPNFSVDLSSRLGHLQLQGQTDREGVRDFLIQYSDRIIYGTDAYNNVEKLESALVNDWQYLSTCSDCVSTEIEGTFKGLGLPEEVLRNIYYYNALRYYTRLRQGIVAE